jgi:two-component system response regulator FlrC
MQQAEKTFSVRPSVLVVEDDYTLREAMIDTLEQAGFDCMAARHGQEALTLMDQFGFRLVLTDLQMPQMDGLALVPKILEKKPYMPIMIMTAFGSVEKAVHAIKLGATDFISKPFDCEVLIEKIQQHTQSIELAARENSTALELGQHWDLTSQSPKMQQAIALAKRVAMTDATVLINGASGTGKEVMSRFIHQSSSRAEGPFVAINCAAIPENMLEAILFGHEKGAFTGALTAMPGKFEQANGGTLLLDEVTEMPLALQAKLLRVLQEKEVERIGGKRVIALDVRVIATSNRDLVLAVQQGDFREDLFYRLNVFPVRLPTLAERTEDLVSLVEFLLKKHGGQRRFSLSADAVERLKSHAWPGNIRELENVVQRAIVLTDGNVLNAANLLIEPIGDGDTLGVNVGRDAIQTVDVSNLDESATPTEVSAKALEDNLRQQEHKIIIDVLRQTGGRRKLAAEKLGISTRTLRYKLARLKSMGVDINDLLEA